MERNVVGRLLYYNFRIGFFKFKLRMRLCPRSFMEICTAHALLMSCIVPGVHWIARKWILHRYKIHDVYVMSYFQRYITALTKQFNHFYTCSALTIVTQPLNLLLMSGSMCYCACHTLPIETHSVMTVISELPASLS